MILPTVPNEMHAEIMAAPRTPESHRRLMARMPAMDLLELGGKATKARLPSQICAAAWNVERCLFPRASADHLRPHGPDVILLSEMDSGMARTGQRNTSADMAASLGCTYAFGVEFFELGLGGARERSFCADSFNRQGWHGNAVLSKAPFLDTLLVRLDDDGHWFIPGEGRAGNPEQPRIGGRMAVLGLVESEAGPVCFASTHLESRSDAAFRHAQFTRLLRAIDAFAPDCPVLIGGDLNTGNHMPPKFDWRDETLFGLAEAQGYDWALNAEGTTTRDSLISPNPNRTMKLDWFASRGLSGSARPVLPSIDQSGRPLSDHDCVLCDVRVAN